MAISLFSQNLIIINVDIIKDKYVIKKVISYYFLCNSELSKIRCKFYPPPKKLKIESMKEGEDFALLEKSKETQIRKYELY